jgi:hypothetical protein
MKLPRRCSAIILGRLPVVDRRDPDRAIGYLGRPGIMVARLRRLEEEHVREPGWVKLRASVDRANRSRLLRRTYAFALNFAHLAL